ncbi:MAG: hypothetical protein ABIG44_10535 [Planctomycetota bacterium]
MPKVVPSELSFLSVDIRPPYMANYPCKDGGKTGRYMLRWVAMAGEEGSWSETASATIRA